jgi:hypothetical protein
MRPGAPLLVMAAALSLSGCGCDAELLGGRADGGRDGGAGEDGRIDAPAPDTRPPGCLSNADCRPRRRRPTA